ncbi:WD40 repeat-like protein [Annulohypoxylon truncatum]|uniref:WD40 repeat-like protein n=1 Tax=Annulohypoxylon truncatum TaxID=327061 RepID=UPI002008976D|nr:WD40 repeat-like protein [Annulohypoxylon truncatum]KAI1205799.1 WD40 repeat-like protein [Annulohypoxylon truncatum]
MSQYQPAQPRSVLRGHRAQVHVTTFIRSNQRLASGDADGFVILWDLTIMRPRTVWRAHTNAILGISDWGDDKIITHGRDNRLVVWKLGSQDEIAMSTALPLDESAPERPQPWILYILEVNTLNFCSFTYCPPASDTAQDELLIAVPNTLESEAVDIFHLPSQSRQRTAHLGSNTDNKGMVMSVRLFWHQGYLTLVAAYESGLAVLAQLRRGETWDILYRAQVHSQPVLSLDVDPHNCFFLTSGADAVIAKHPIPTAASLVKESQGTRQTSNETAKDPDPSLLSATLSSAPRVIPPRQTRPSIETQPLKTINTKHSGQQSLRIRSDGKIFATAGWDSKVRVYSTKTMSELAVLKWHDVGCYAVAFAILIDEQSLDPMKSNTRKEETNENPKSGLATSTILDNRDATHTSTLPKPGQLSVKDRRIKMAKGAHWLAAGSKDGKISLWDIY